MSGAQATFPFPTNLETLPPGTEGSKVVAVSLAWATLGSIAAGYQTTVNLLAQFLSGQFTTVQALYIDNSTNAFPVTVQCADSRQSVICPPFSQGMFTLISEAAAQYRVTLGLVAYPGGNAFPPGTTRLFFLNTPQKPYLLQQLANGTNFQVATGVIAAWLATTQIMPALGPLQHYAISSLTLTVMSGGATAVFAAAQPISLLLLENVTSFALFRDSFYATTSAGLFYSKQTVFPTPSIQFTDASGLSIGTLNQNASTTLGYPASPFYYATWQLTYGIVTIQ